MGPIPRYPDSKKYSQGRKGGTPPVDLLVLLGGGSSKTEGGSTGELTLFVFLRFGDEPMA